MKDVGEPDEGEPHVRFDGRELEKERATDTEHGSPSERTGPEPDATYSPSPRQLPTRPTSREAVAASQIMTEWDDDVSWPLFVARVLEETQQWLHDTFVDTTWPRCPEHGNHPLWLTTTRTRLGMRLHERRSVQSGKGHLTPIIHRAR